MSDGRWPTRLLGFNCDGASARNYTYEDVQSDNMLFQIFLNGKTSLEDHYMLTTRDHEVNIPWHHACKRNTRISIGPLHNQLGSCLLTGGSLIEKSLLEIGLLVIYEYLQVRSSHRSTYYYLEPSTPNQPFVSGIPGFSHRRATFKRVKSMWENHNRIPFVRKFCEFAEKRKDEGLAICDKVDALQKIHTPAEITSMQIICPYQAEIEGRVIKCGVQLHESARYKRHLNEVHRFDIPASHRFDPGQKLFTAGIVYEATPEGLQPQPRKPRAEGPTRQLKPGQQDCGAPVGEDECGDDPPPPFPCTGSSD